MSYYKRIVIINEIGYFNTYIKYMEMPAYKKHDKTPLLLTEIFIQLPIGKAQIGLTNEVAENFALQIGWGKIGTSLIIGDKTPIAIGQARIGSDYRII